MWEEYNALFTINTRKESKKHTATTTTATRANKKKKEETKSERASEREKGSLITVAASKVHKLATAITLK